MTTAPTTAGLPSQRWSLKHYAILTALILAVVAVAFGLFSQTSTVPVEADEPVPVTGEPARGRGGNCAERFVVTGGVLEGDRPADRCPPPGGQPMTGGVLP